MEDENRCTGRSTRLIDEYIQKLFTTGCVTVIDHCNEKHNNMVLLTKIMSRIKNEHPHILEKISINKGSLKIKLNDPDIILKNRKLKFDWLEKNV